MSYDRGISGSAQETTLISSLSKSLPWTPRALPSTMHLELPRRLFKLSSLLHLEPTVMLAISFFYPLGYPNKRFISQFGTVLSITSESKVVLIGMPQMTALGTQPLCTRVSTSKINLYVLWYKFLQEESCLSHIAHLTLMLINCRRKEQSWEVVDCKTVEPVPTYDDDGESPRLDCRWTSVFWSVFPDLDVLFVSETETRGTYVFDIRSRTEHCGHHLRRLVVFAQQQLLREVKKRGFDVLLTEGYGNQRREIHDANGVLYIRRWTLTLLRKGKNHRAEVQYIARGQCRGTLSHSIWCSSSLPSRENRKVSQTLSAASLYGSLVFGALGRPVYFFF